MVVEKTVGEQGTINANITNTGNVDATFSIQAGLTGPVTSRIVGTIEQLIPAGQSSQVSFPFVADEVGTFDVTVSVAHGGKVLDSMALPAELVVRETTVYSAQIVSVTVT